MRSSALVVTLALGLCAHDAGAARFGAARAAGKKADRDDAPRRGRAWLSSASHDTEGEAFERADLLSRIASGEEKLVAFDRAGGAKQPADPSARYVVIRDIGGGGHILGILTPAAGQQPEHIFDTAALSPAPLGAVFNAVLQADKAATGRNVNGWRARVNMPDRISQHILHVHGDAGRSRLAPLAGKAVPKGDFSLYEGKQLAATAPVPTTGLSAAHEELLGRMVMAVAALAKSRGITDGSIEVARNEAQLTVRLQTGGGFSFFGNE